MTQPNGETAGTSTETSGTTATTSSATEQGQQTATGTQAPTTGQTPAVDPFAGWDGKVESLPEAAQRIIRDARSEAANSRVTAKTAAEQAQAELVQSIGKALGLVKDNEQPDPAKLTEQLTATQAQARQTAVELALFRTAAKHEGDPAALTDSRTFLAKVANLDPAAVDFEDQVIAAAKTAITDNPKLKAAQAAAASSVDHTGGSGEGGVTPEQFKAMSYEERVHLYETNPALYNQLTGRTAQ